jgi:aminoglycoside/choline kinase family phosphotransferase
MESEESMITRRRKGALPPPPSAILAKALGVEAVQTSWLAGDGSDRCYYRILIEGSRETFVLMQLSGTDADALKENRYQWIEMAKLLERFQVKIPTLKAVISDYAALIIQDYGDTMLEQVVNQENKVAHLTPVVHRHYQDAFQMIGRFLNISPDSSSVWCQRSFDMARLSWELDFFRKEFLEAVVGWTFTTKEEQFFCEDTKKISEYLGGFAHYFVHRDFHSRNLMVQHEKLAVLDFQDARLGPAAYDLVSLVFDSYVSFDDSERMTLLNEGIEVLEKTNLIGKDELALTWRPTLLHRQLKAIGSFGYLTVNKNRGDYLRYVEPALNTLKIDQNMTDSRWPFLSHEIPMRLSQILGEHPYG